MEELALALKARKPFELIHTWSHAVQPAVVSELWGVLGHGVAHKILQVPSC